jgi:hypothetical protein
MSACEVLLSLIKGELKGAKYMGSVVMHTPSECMTNLMSPVLATLVTKGCMATCAE